MVESHIPMLFQHPMVEETNIWDSSLKVVLDDSVLKKHLDYVRRFSPSGSLLQQHADWIFNIFPELVEEGDIPRPWIWSDLITRVSNIGTVDDATKKYAGWETIESKVAYWTGGLEFTRNHYEVSKHLKDGGLKILLGLEPFCYSNEYKKEKGSLSGDAIPLSFWSKHLGDNGFVFTIPRPIPSGKEGRNLFYSDLYQKVTKGNGYIVVSERDSFKDEKKERGPIIEVPEFNYPTTTELYNSFFR